MGVICSFCGLDIWDRDRDWHLYAWNGKPGQAGSDTNLWSEAAGTYEILLLLLIAWF